MKVSINEIEPRNVVLLDKQKGIYNNGDDNAYPQRIEKIINNSVTAKSAANKAASFFMGDGFVNESLNDFVVYSDVNGKVTLYKLLSQIANTISKQNAAACWLKYDGTGKITGVRHEPYRNCRIGKKDDDGYSGFIHVYNNWEKRKGETFNQAKIKKINSYNPDLAIVLSQWEKYGRNYEGQIAMLSLDDEFVYPLAKIDPALEDADTEGLIKNFTNMELQKGFFGKWILHHTKFADEAEQAAFKKTLRQFEGGNSTARVLMAEAEFDEKGELISSSNFKLEPMQQNINDKLFEYYEKSRANNIRKAFCNIPSILIEQQEASMFGSSGEAMTVAFDVYNAETKNIRKTISQWLKDILSHSVYEQLKNEDFEIKPLSFVKSQTQPTI